MADRSRFFCSLCEKDCYFRSKFDRHLRSTCHKLQENVQKITSESRKQSALCTTLELAASAGAVDYGTETATDTQALVSIYICSTYIYSVDPLISIQVDCDSSEEVTDHSEGDVEQSSDTEEIGLVVLLFVCYYLNSVCLGTADLDDILAVVPEGSNYAPFLSKYQALAFILVHGSRPMV